MVTGIRIPDILERAFCTPQTVQLWGEMTTAKQSWAFDRLQFAPLAAGHLMVLCDTQQLGNHHNSHNSCLVVEPGLETEGCAQYHRGLKAEAANPAEAQRSQGHTVSSVLLVQIQLSLILFPGETGMYDSHSLCRACLCQVGPRGEESGSTGLSAFSPSLPPAHCWERPHGSPHRFLPLQR